MQSNLSAVACVKILLLVIALNPVTTFAAGDATSLSGIVYPVMSPKFTSGFGNRNHPIQKIKKHHGGVDLAAPVGAPIRSIQAGTVVFADSYRGYGKLVVILHPNGLTSHYGHCDNISAEIGQKIAAGEIIATVGKTGRTTGPHLHFEMRRDGKTLDPELYLPALRAPARG